MNGYVILETIVNCTMYDYLILDTIINCNNYKFIIHTTLILPDWITTSLRFPLPFRTIFWAIGTFQNPLELHSTFDYHWNFILPGFNLHWSYSILLSYLFSFNYFLQLLICFSTNLTYSVTFIILNLSLLRYSKINLFVCHMPRFFIRSLGSLLYVLYQWIVNNRSQWTNKK